MNEKAAVDDQITLYPIKYLNYSKLKLYGKMAHFLLSLIKLFSNPYTYTIPTKVSGFQLYLRIHYQSC
jgi:hypothetical protein